jgi:hypothetical protein
MADLSIRLTLEQSSTMQGPSILRQLSISAKNSLCCFRLNVSGKCFTTGVPARIVISTSHLGFSALFRFQVQKLRRLPRARDFFFQGSAAASRLSRPVIASRSSRVVQEACKLSFRFAN